MNLTHCVGPRPRREFLRAGALALGGVELADLHRAWASQKTAPPDTSVILFWMWGGPSHLETYDPKPQAPSEYRGPLRPIATSVPGIEICEVFPKQARLAHHFSLVRSLHHGMSSHNDGSIEMLTGKTPQPDPTSTAKSEHPDFGMVVSKLRGRPASGAPSYVGIPRQPFMTRPQYLGLAHRAFDAADPSRADYRPPNLTLTAGIDGGELGDRVGLLTQLDHLRRDLDASGQMEGLDGFRGDALRMLTSPAVARAFDLSKEHPRTRDRYGRHLWGQSCLLARRLAEAGTAVITIDALAPTLSDKYFSWDDHCSPEMGWGLEGAMRYRAPFMDQAMAALIEDIYERGLDRKILVVAMGEFGRTPRVSTRGGLLGRDHWPDAMCALLSGGGIRPGVVVGATNSKGEFPQERPLTPRDLLATLYRHLGVDPTQSLHDFFGRPVPILSDGQPIADLAG